MTSLKFKIFLVLFEATRLLNNGPKYLWKIRKLTGINHREFKKWNFSKKVVLIIVVFRVDISGVIQILNFGIRNLEELKHPWIVRMPHMVLLQSELWFKNQVTIGVILYYTCKILAATIWPWHKLWVDEPWPFFYFFPHTSVLLHFWENWAWWKPRFLWWALNSWFCFPWLVFVGIVERRNLEASTFPLDGGSKINSLRIINHIYWDHFGICFGIIQEM